MRRLAALQGEQWQGWNEGYDYEGYEGATYVDGDGCQYYQQARYPACSKLLASMLLPVDQCPKSRAGQSRLSQID